MERSKLGAGLLADDMGLGKTISALTYHVLAPWYLAEGEEAS